MSLAISNIIVTAMQRIVLQISAAEPVPSGYEITLARVSTGEFITDEFNGLVYRSPQLCRPEECQVTLTALYADPDDNQTIQLPDLVSVDPQEGMATILRQAVWDIFFDTELEVDGRPLFAIHDGRFRPAVLRRSEVPDMPMPSVEVGMPMLRQTAFQSGSRKVEEWRVPIRLLDEIHKENPDDFGRIWYLSEALQAAVDLTDNLNLGGRGVLDKGWSWRVMEDANQERDRMSGLKLWLTVHVQRAVGAVGR